MGEKRYVGSRQSGKARVWIWVAGDKPRFLPHFVHHSPTGLEWGYGGSGPADLALALAADVIGPEKESVSIYRGKVGRRAMGVHQELKFQVVAHLPQEQFSITAQVIRNAIEEIEKRRGEAGNG